MSVALNLIQYRLLKYTLGRRRPYHEAGHDAFFEYHDWNGGAFPSGHTSTAFSFWGAYASYYREGVTPYLLYVPATLAGLARIYSDKHWFSDVTGGALLGLTSVHLGIVLNNWLFPRDPVQLVFHSDLKDTVVGVRVGF
jgi:membrane-associated phospholipid phosphatase